MERRSLVNALTLARLPFVALATWAARAGDPLSTITFGLSAVATDIGDGMLARRWDVESEWGSNFDSLMDSAFYMLLIYWIYLFRPDVVLDNFTVIAGFVVAYGLLLGWGQLLQRSIAQHDIVSRAAGTAVGVAGAWWIAFSYHQWMFFVVALFVTADIAHRLHGAVQALAHSRRGLDEG